MIKINSRRIRVAIHHSRPAPLDVPNTPRWSCGRARDDVHNGRFRPISAHYVKAGFDSSGKLTAWHHRIAVDRVGPYMDPVRYQMSGGKDFIAMLGADPRGYDVPHQLVEQLYRDTGVRTNPLRGISFTANKFATETFIGLGLWKKCGAEEPSLECAVRGRATETHGSTVMNRTPFRFGQGERDGEPLGVAWCVIIAIAISSSAATAKEKFQKLTGPQIRAKIAGMEVLKRWNAAPPLPEPRICDTVSPCEAETTLP